MPRKITPLLLYHLYVRRMVALLAAVIILCAFLYAFFLLEAVSHAASQAAARRQVAALSSKVGVLQTQYLSATRSLTPERAKNLGFVPPAAVVTVYADQGTLTLNSGR